MTTVVKAKKAVIYKTIYEFCKSEINIEVEVLSIAKHLGFFTADDLHVLDPSLEKMEIKPQVYGVIIKHLLETGKIRFVRYVPSSRRQNHGRPIGEYQYIWG
jgi:hypothetical protein